MRILIVVALTTALLRFIPFILFKDRKLSESFSHVIDALPYASISLLVVYAFKDVNSSNLFPSIIASIICIISYHYKRSSALSITLSTIVYMFLI